MTPLCRKWPIALSRLPSITILPETKKREFYELNKLSQSTHSSLLSQTQSMIQIFEQGHCDDDLILKLVIHDFRWKIEGQVQHTKKEKTQNYKNAKIQKT